MANTLLGRMYTVLCCHLSNILLCDPTWQETCRYPLDDGINVLNIRNCEVAKALQLIPDATWVTQFLELFPFRGIYSRPLHAEAA